MSAVECQPLPAHARGVRLSEEVILDRLQEFQDAVELPSVVYDFLLHLLCPEALADPPPPAEPTDALPGTAAKIRVLAERLARGESLFHPDDAAWEDDASDRLGLQGCRLRNGVAGRAADAPMLLRTAEGLQPVNGPEETPAPAPIRLAEAIAPAPKRQRQTQKRTPEQRNRSRLGQQRSAMRRCLTEFPPEEIAVEISTTMEPAPLLKLTELLVDTVVAV